MNINYKSDFKVTVTPTVGGTPVDITGHDFRLVFTTTGGSRRFTASQKDGVCENCYIEGTAIVVTLDNHCLPTGQLWVSVYDYAPDVTYPDGNELTVTPQQLDVTLVRGAGDGSAVDAQVSVDIGEAVSAAREAADAAGASADIARAAQVAAEAAAERAEQVDGYTKAEADTLLALKADKTELNEVEDALHDAILDVSGRVDNKADKPLTVNITSEEVEGETVYHADKTTAEIHAAVLAGRNVVAHNDNYEFMLDAAESGMAIFSLSYSNGVQQIVIDDGIVALNVTSFANDDEFSAAKRNITDLQDNKADKVPVLDVSGTTVTQALQPNKFYRFGSVDALTLTLATAPSGTLAIYACSFTAASDSTTLTLPATVTGEAPTIAAGHRYELNIMDNVLLYTENGND